MNFLEELEWRGLLEEVTPGLEEALAEETLTAYIGFDPTAASLHVGSLLQILLLARLQRAGHRPLAVAGGGTGLIGDPSGKSQERVLLTHEQVEENLVGIRRQLEPLLDFDAGEISAEIVNNADWLLPITLMEFLRDVGKHFTVNQMLAKESVRRRISQEEGISYTEFSYMLLQAYDYLVLHDRYGCRLQMGGSDQWGNILAGADLIRKVRGERAYGVVVPLVTNASGTKFGKTEAGTVWLDPNLTSPYRFYQFWLNTTDDDVVRYLKFFTWLGKDEIDALASSVESAPQERRAQKTLAAEVTRMVHGEEALSGAERVTALLFGGEVEGVRAADLLEALSDAPSSELARGDLEGKRLSDLLVLSGLTPSKGAARRLMTGGGIYLNNRRAAEDRPVTLDDAIEGQVFLLRKGRKEYHLVRLRE